MLFRTEYYNGRVGGWRKEPRVKLQTLAELRVRWAGLDRAAGALEALAAGADEVEIPADALAPARRITLHATRVR